MEKDSSTTSIVLAANAAASPTITVPPTVSVNVPSIASTSTIHVLPTHAKPFLDFSKIEVFSGQNFKRWKELIYSTLDMHGVAWLLSRPNPRPKRRVGMRHGIETL